MATRRRPPRQIALYKQLRMDDQACAPTRAATTAWVGRLLLTFAKALSGGIRRTSSRLRSASRGEISMLHRLVDPPRLIGCEADEDARLEGQRRIVPWAAYRALGPWVAHGTPMANPGGDHGSTYPGTCATATPGSHPRPQWCFARPPRPELPLCNADPSVALIIPWAAYRVLGARLKAQAPRPFVGGVDWMHFGVFRVIWKPLGCSSIPNLISSVQIQHIASLAA